MDISFDAGMPINLFVTGTVPGSEERGKPCAEGNLSIYRSSRSRSSPRSSGHCAARTLRTSTFAGQSSRNCSLRIHLYAVSRLQKRSGCTSSRFGNGENDGRPRGSPSKTSRDRGVPRLFPPRDEAIVVAVACELPSQHERPLSRLFVPDIHRILIEEGHFESISASTIWRILDSHALKPWRRRSWIWSRDPIFYERAARVLDLYAGKWRAKPLGADEFVLSADEKTSIQARIRLHPTEIHADGRGLRVEHEYKRGGAWAYLAAYDVFRAKVFGRVEKKTGIAPFDRLVAQVMSKEPYASARQVFWIVDQGSSHRPTTFPDRLRAQFPNATAVMLPVHASWLNQIEIYFSILQRKALTPNDFADLTDVRQRLHRFARLFISQAEPFDWKFTRAKLRRLLKKIPSPGERADRVVRARLKVAG